MGSFQFQIVPCSSLYFSRSIGPFQCLVNANYEVLICCTCHFQRVSLFVYFGFLCLQISSVSNFLPDTRGGEVGHLCRLTCSVALWGGRSTGNKYHWRVWGVLTVSGPHWVCPDHGVCAFPVYIAQAPGCSAAELSKAGPGSHALPRSKLLSFRFSGTPPRYRLGWASVLCRSHVRAAQTTRCLVNALPQVCGASHHLPSLSCSVSCVHKESLSQVCCVSLLRS